MGDGTRMQLIKKFFKRYFIDAMSAMALGLFSSLIIGLVISQFARIPALSFLEGLSDVLSASSPVVGAAIGTAIAWGLGAKPLVIFSGAACGAIGYMAGGPVGAYIAAVIGSEAGGLVAEKTGIDIVITPVVTIVCGGLVGQFAGGYIQNFMNLLGGVINDATELSPFSMGIAVAVIVGMVLTAPISSAALCIMLDLSGLAAGAAAAGCCAQMVGFAVIGVRDNGWGSLVSVGLGTSMLQFSNIMRRPQIWIAPIVAAAIAGPVSTCVFKMANTAIGAGMGTCGIVGQFGAFAAMEGSRSTVAVGVQVALVHFLIPALSALAVHTLLQKIGWVKKGDLLLQKLKPGS